MKFIRDEDDLSGMESIYFNRLQKTLPAQRKELSLELVKPQRHERRRPRAPEK